MKKRYVVTAVIILMLASFSMILASNEGENSAFVLKLKGGEDRVKYVETSPPGSVYFQMELFKPGLDNPGTHEFELTIADLSYSGGSSAGSWDFTFTDADHYNGSKAVYYVTTSSAEDVTLRVDFLGALGGEKVTFGITGTESGFGDETPDRNSTFLSPYDGHPSDIEFLTVTSSTNYNPFWEAATYADRLEHSLPLYDTFTIRLWNLGSQNDDLCFSGWQVWEDINGDGQIDGGDTQNKYFGVNFKTLGGLPIAIDENIYFASGESEEFSVIVNPSGDRSEAPYGQYLLKIDVESDSSSITHSELLQMRIEQLCVHVVSDGGDNVGPGDTITYTITIFNNDPGWQTGIDVDDYAPTGTTYVSSSSSVTAPSNTTNTVRDEFNAQSYGNNDGTENWAGNWVDSEGDGPISGDYQVIDDFSNYQLRTRDDNKRIQREADLSGYDEATLSLDYRRFSLDKVGEYIDLEISSKGAAGPWTRLDRWEGRATDSTYTFKEYDITQYISANTMIRFGNGVLKMGNIDAVWFDDIQIEYSKRANVTSPGGAAPDLASGYALAPGESMQVTFQVDVDDPLDSEIYEIWNNATVTSNEETATFEAAVVDLVGV